MAHLDAGDPDDERAARWLEGIDAALEAILARLDNLSDWGYSTEADTARLRAIAKISSK